MKDDPEEANTGAGHEAQGGLDGELARKFGFEGEEWVEAARRAARGSDGLGRLGGYELVQEIGRGAQGAVYKAVQPGTGRIVALKRLGAGFPMHLRHREHLRREVEALTPLNHPNVVAVFAAEELEGHAVLVMEYVDGTSIDRWADAQWASLPPGRPPPGRPPPGRPPPGRPSKDALHAVLRCFVGLCEGVSHAHQLGVIHRDIKPSNALVTAHGTAKVVDFGIARVMSGWPDAAPAGGVSVTGFAGTPAYAAPEQVLGGSRALDTRCDVYALGVLLRRMITGVDLFGPGASLAEIVDAARAGMAGREPASRLRAGVPTDLDWVVRKAMRADPSERYQTVDALAEDVRRVLDGRATAAHPPSLRYTASRFIGRHWLACGLAVASVLTIVALAWVSMVQAVRHRETSSFLLGLVEKISESSDGRSTIPIEDLVTWIDAPDDSARATMDPVVRARLSLALGVMYNVAGRNDLATMHDRRALDLLTRRGNESLRVRTLIRLAVHDRPSLPLAREAVEYMRRVGLEDSEQGVEILRHLAVFATRKAKYDEAFDAIERARGIARRLGLGVEIEALIESDEAASHLFRGRLDPAAAAARRALEMMPEERRSTSEACRRASVTLGEVAYRQGDVREAERLFGQVEALMLVELGDGHIRTRNAMRWHARTLHELGRYKEAAPIYERLIQLIPPRRETTDRGVWAMRFRYAATLLGQGRTQEAERQMRLAITRGGAAERPELESDVAAARRALENSALKFTPALRTELGALDWLVDFTSDAPKHEEAAAR